MIKGSIDAGDRIQKLAIQSGLSTELLSELDHAAELSGTTLETVAKGNRRLQRSAVEAAKGTKLYREAFAELGLDANKFLSLKPDEQFAAYADAISKIENPAKRTALANDLLGRSGSDLIPLMEGGAKSMAKMRAEARKLGKTLSRKQADDLAAVNDSVLKLQNGFVGVANALAIKLAPAMTQFFNFLTAKLPTFVDLLGSALGGVGNLVGGGAAAIGALLSGNFRGAASIAGDVFGDVKKDLGGVVSGLDKLANDPVSKEQVNEQKTSNQHLATIARAVQRGVPAVAQ